MTLKQITYHEEPETRRVRCTVVKLSATAANAMVAQKLGGRANPPLFRNMILLKIIGIGIRNSGP